MEGLSELKHDSEPKSQNVSFWKCQNQPFQHNQFFSGKTIDTKIEQNVGIVLIEPNLQCFFSFFSKKKVSQENFCPALWVMFLLKGSLSSQWRFKPGALAQGTLPAAKDRRREKVACDWPALSCGLGSGREIRAGD